MDIEFKQLVPLFFITNMKYIDESICEVNIENNKIFCSKTCKKNYSGLIGLGFHKKQSLKNKVLSLLTFKWINCPS